MVTKAYPWLPEARSGQGLTGKEDQRTFRGDRNYLYYVSKLKELSKSNEFYCK